MSGPKIIFCSNNHIYDAALHSECPYCRKIAEDQNALSRSIGIPDISEKANSEDENDEATELINNSTSEEDACTELIRPRNTASNIEQAVASFGGTIINKGVVSDDGREVNSSKDHICNIPPVLGWIICKAGYQEGRSFELVNGENFLCVEKGEYLITYNKPQRVRELAQIIRNPAQRAFVIQPAIGIECKTNYQSVRESVLKNYDVINLNGQEFLFVELLETVVRWGDTI